MAERDYLERTIATIRIHGGSDNSWPQWANILADEIERLWAERDAQLESNSKGSEGRGNREHLSSARAAIPPGPEAVETVSLPNWLRVTAGKLGWNQAERNNLTRSADALEACAARLKALEAERTTLMVEAQIDLCQEFIEASLVDEAFGVGDIIAKLNVLEGVLA